MTDDLVTMVQRHVGLLARLLAASSGAIGEILVADMLTTRGYTVEPTNNNARQHDLTAMAPDGRRIAIEVKTSRDRRATWFVNTCPDPAHSQIWCFVVAPRAATELPHPDDIEIYVLTTEEAAQIWSASEYNKANPKAADIRRHQIPDDARDAWGKLETVAA